MKITIDLPDPLLQKAQMLAAMRDESLNNVSSG